VTQWQWVRSRDGLSVDAQGMDTPALLPRDNDMVLLVPAHQLSWHQVLLPRMPQNRVRQALNGVLEDALLTDPADLHLALAPDFELGRLGWVAAIQKTVVMNWLASLQAAQRPAARIVPELAPANASPQLQVWMESDQAWLGLSSVAGVACWPLPAPDGFAVRHSDVGAWVRALQASSPAAWSCYSEPACLAQAEASLDVNCQLEAPGARWLRSAQSEWDLAQFDLKLSAGARRSQRLHQAWRDVLHSRPWRAARWGLLALGLSFVLVVAGLTWQERQLLAAKQQRIRQTLTEVFPHITLILDAPVQMQRELAVLQRNRGSLSLNDLEVVLHELGGKVPADALLGIESNASVTRLQFASGAENVVQALATALQQRGWRVQTTGLVLELRRTANPS
jgi:general secretion pathway protein L